MNDSNISQYAEIWIVSPAKKLDLYELFPLQKKLDQNAENAVAYSSHFVEFPRKAKNTFLKGSNLCKTLPYFTILHVCAQVNLRNCIAFSRKRFYHYFPALISLCYPGCTL